MSDYQHLIYEQRGPVTIITINRPERMNAIGPQTHRELVDAWDRFRADDAALVGVLTGAGDKAFCAGGDLKAAGAGELELDASPDDGVLGPSRWTDIYKPTIAAVNGVAYAGGLEWACWTDMAIADEHATFGVTCRRWNIGLADGGTQRLTRILGYRRAIELIITGRVIDAQRGRTHRSRQSGRPERNLPAAGTRAGRVHRRAPAAGAAQRPGSRPHRAGSTARRRAAHRGAMLQPVDLRVRNLRRPTPIQRTRPPGPSRGHRTRHARSRPVALSLASQPPRATARVRPWRCARPTTGRNRATVCPRIWRGHCGPRSPRWTPKYRGTGWSDGRLGAR